MYITHFCGPTATVLFFGLYPIAELLRGNRKLPFNAWYPYDYKISPIYELTYFHQLTAPFTMAQIQVHTDCLSINLIAILIAQLDILADNVKNISRTKYQQSDKASEMMETELLDCIQHHKEILSCFGDVYQFLNITMFAQFLISTISLCLTLLELSVLSPASTHFAALIIYMSALMVELLLFCWWGNLLIVKSQLLPQAAFECDWLAGSITFRKNLSFFIFRAQKEMALYAVDFFKISLGSFVLILKNSYSFYAVLRRANNAATN
ncbi:odorant receptor 42a-like isoform X1 [Zophobas morio]